MEYWHIIVCNSGGHLGEYAEEIHKMLPGLENFNCGERLDRQGLF